MESNQWLNKEEYPFKSHFFPVNGQKLHYIDEGSGPTLLYVHGTPSWSFDFRNVIKRLSSDFRCVAIDHIGFGLSDKPKAYDYSTVNHAKTLEQFILNKDLKDLTLVVHDFGGPIGLNFAIRHPERIKNLVIMNSWMWSAEDDEDYKKFRRILKNPLLPFLYRYLNFSARFLLPGVFGNQKMRKEIHRQYIRPFSNKSKREGTVAFARSLLNDQSWFQTLWEQKEKIHEKKTLFIWGMKDPMLRPAYLEKFESGFPNSTSIRLEDCGHFPQEEDSESVAQEILNDLESN